jgi:hypothetical protein
MDKFEKAAVWDDGVEPLQFVDSTGLTPLVEDPLRFTVETSDRIFVDLDLTRYRDGDSRLGLMGFPNLIMDLLPTIKKQIGQKRRSGGAIRGWLPNWLSPLFKAITEMRRLTGKAPESADEFQDADGVFLQSYFVGLSGSKAKTRKDQYSVVYSMIRQTRSETASRLRWPWSRV